MTPSPRCSSHVSGQRPGEAAERRLVVAGEQHEVVAAPPLRLGAEAQLAAVLAADAREVGSRSSPAVARRPRGSRRPWGSRRPRGFAGREGLAGRRWEPTHTARSDPWRGSLTPLTRFHASSPPSGPSPTPALQSHSVWREWCPAVSSITARACTGCGRRPSSARRPLAATPACLRVHTIPRPCGHSASIPASSCELELERHAAIADPQAAGLEQHLAAAGAQARALAQLVLLAVIQRPEGLLQRPHVHDRRAGHEALAEDPHVAPALQRARAVEQGGGGRGGQRSEGFGHHGHHDQITRVESPSSGIIALEAAGGELEGDRG